MSPHRRIPNVIALLDDYLRNTDDFLQEVIDPLPPVYRNWQRLGLNQQSADEWHDRRMYWQDELYPKYRGAATKTKAVNADVKSFMKDFIAFGSPLLNVMASSYAVMPTDALLFRFKIGRKKRSRSVTPISDPCFPLVKSLGGSFIKVSCRTGHGSGRPALPAGADSVMLAFKAGEPMPETEEDCPKTVIISRAAFIYEVGAAHSASYLYLFARWHNTKNHNLSGIWSNRVCIVLG